jgi:hypothetical protein
MIKSNKPKNFWFGLTIFGYSLFLFCQGIWMSIYYQYIFPEISWMPSGYVPNYSWIFEKIGVLAPSIVGGFIFMVIGLIITKISLEKSSHYLLSAHLTRRIPFNSRNNQMRHTNITKTLGTKKQNRTLFKRNAYQCLIKKDRVGVYISVGKGQTANLSFLSLVPYTVIANPDKAMPTPT